MVNANSEYDITAAFRTIENELMESMIRNMDRHRAEEDGEEILWSQWQAEQLKALELYKIKNQKKYEKKFRMLNKAAAGLIESANARGNMEQEIKILEAIRDGFKGYREASKTLQGEFFRLNERKLEALVKATTEDMEKAETAILRMANDKYRKVIFNAQVYANTGAGTYEKAIDMATRDFLAAGLNCVEYANGARHTLPDYIDMALRTAGKRAYLQGEGLKRQEWGTTLVIMNKRGNPCPKCLPWVGKVLIDDVWSGGKKEDGDYPLMSYAISKGLYHPRCKDSHTTYFPGVSTAEDTWTRKELEEVGLQSKEEARQQYAERQAEKYERLAKYSLDGENKRKYAARKEQWEIQANKYLGKSVVKSDDFAIIKAGTSSTIAMASRIPDAMERSKVINEAIRAKESVYAEELRAAYGNIKKKEGCMDICIHGTPYYTEYEGKYNLDTETLAYIISGRKEFEGNNIRLLSCSTGKVDKYGNCVAQELADRLKVKVCAPIDILNIHPDGRLTVGKENLSEEDGFKWFEQRKRGI